MLVEFENVFLIGGIFLKLGAKNNFGIEKISYFGNYMDPWFLPILHTTYTGLVTTTTRLDS